MDGHKGDKGVDLQPGKAGNNGAHKKILFRNFLRSGVTSDEDTVTGNCNFGFGVTGKLGVEPHGIFGKTFDEPGDKMQGMVCGFGSRTVVGVEFDVGKIFWDSDGVSSFDELLHAGEDKQIFIKYFKRSGL